MQSGKRRCARCRYEFIPHKLPLTFSRDEWKEILHLFLMEQSSNSIAEQTGFEQRRVLRALTKIRFVMAKDIPEIFSGTVEVDETYLGGQWKNKRKTIRDKGTKRGRGTKKQPVFGILCRNGTVWAEVVDDVDRKDRLHLFLGEYVWRYNHRSDPERIKMRRLIQLLEKIRC